MLTKMATQIPVTQLRIMLADDNAMIRRGLRTLLESCAGWTVCAEAIDGNSAIAKAVELRPDVILLDLSMPDLSGFEVAKRIHDQAPECATIVVTEQDARLMAQLPSQAGVRAYVAKSRLALDLMPTIEQVLLHTRASVPPAKIA